MILSFLFSLSLSRFCYLISLMVLFIFAGSGMVPFSLTDSDTLRALKPHFYTLNKKDIFYNCFFLVLLAASEVAAPLIAASRMAAL